MDTVELTFKYTQDECVEAERLYLFVSKILTKTSVVVLALYLPFSVLYAFFSAFGLLSVIALGIAVFSAGLGGILYFFLPAYRFKQTAKYHEPYHLIFLADGIIFKTPTIHSELSWSVYSEWWESDAFYFLIQAPRIYTLIPKRAFKSPAACLAFEEIAFKGLKREKRVL